MGKPTNAAIVDLNGRQWAPFESTTPTGYVTYTADAGEIHVPYGTDPVSKTIQAHELAHVRYTSKVWTDAASALAHLTKLAGTTNAIVGYAEDMRGQALAGRVDVKTLPAFGNPEDKAIITRWVQSFVDAGVPRERVEAAVRFILTEHTSVVKRIGLDLNTLQLAENAERYIVHCAQHLHKLLSRGEDKPRSESSSKEPQKSPDSSDSEPEGEDSDTNDTTPDESKSESKDDKSEDDSEDDTSDSEDGEQDSDSDTDTNDADENSDSEDSDSGEGDEGEGDSDSEDSDESNLAKDGKGDSGGGDGEENEGAESDASSYQSKPAAGEPAQPLDGGEVVDLSTLQLPDVRQAMLKSVPSPVDTQKLIQNFQHTLDTSDWVPVKTIERMPLVRRAAQSRNRGRKLSEVGVNLGSAYDAVAPNERRPFLAKRKGGVGGLTVVIDCSGSMSIDPAQLERLLLTHPQGVVVTYSSAIGWPKENDRAVVRVIASHGRLAATSDFRDRGAGGNGCDGPMLEWLAKQSGDRVWVCDGEITGHGDGPVTYDPAARDAWLKAHRITQFTSLYNYLDSLTR